MTGRMIPNIVFAAMVVAAVMWAYAQAHAGVIDTRGRCYTSDHVRYPCGTVGDVEEIKSWYLDWRRCIARGDARFDTINVGGSLGVGRSDENITSVRIDGVDFPTTAPVNDADAYHFADKEAFLRALARGKRMQIIHAGDPSDNGRVGDGRSLVNFLRRCGR